MRVKNPPTPASTISTPQPPDTIKHDKQHTRQHRARLIEQNHTHNRRTRRADPGPHGIRRPDRNNPHGQRQAQTILTLIATTVPTLGHNRVNPSAYLIPVIQTTSKNTGDKHIHPRHTRLLFVKGTPKGPSCSTPRPCMTTTVIPASGHSERSEESRRSPSPLAGEGWGEGGDRQKTLDSR